MNTPRAVRPEATRAATAWAVDAVSAVEGGGIVLACHGRGRVDLRDLDAVAECHLELGDVVGFCLPGDTYPYRLVIGSGPH